MPWPTEDEPFVPCIGNFGFTDDDDNDGTGGGEEEGEDDDSC